MRVEEKRMVKPLAEVGVGECFECGGVFYMKTDEYTDDGQSMCVAIQNGRLYRFEEEYMVAPVNVKAVVE